MNSIHSNESLEAQLRCLAKTAYPFHMPGHKRRLAPSEDLPVSWDFTEVEGADDLHHAEGILLAAMQRTALLFHAKRTWYLVGGSTVGNLAAIRACAKKGSEILAARNCHKSVYHAIELLDLSVHWLMPTEDADWKIPGSIRPEDVERGLSSHPKCSCVVLTSPTYEGVVSDIGNIANICHAHGVPLVVDEAHGAHFGLFSEGGFPESAITLGADLVVQSAHKTLPSLTQTALLHWNSVYVSEEEVERQLDVFETSSPSYLLMASLDGCTGLLREQGPELFAAWRARLCHLDAAAEKLRHYQILCYGRDTRKQHKSFYDFDGSKLLLRAEDPALTGSQLAAVLRKDYAIESEYHLGRNVLLMTSCADTEEGFSLLERALLDLDQRAGKAGRGTAWSGRTGDEEKGSTENCGQGSRETGSKNKGEKEAGGIDGSGPKEANKQEYREKERKDRESREAESSQAESKQTESNHKSSNRDREETAFACGTTAGETMLPIGDAADLPAEEVQESASAGRIAAEYVFPYPPGIPVLVPGEKITKGALAALTAARAGGSTLIRSRGTREKTIFVLKER